LYLVHFPIAFEYGGLDLDNPIPKDEKGNIKLARVSQAETWKAMEELVEEGLVKAIGISNFSILQTQELLCTAKIVPAVNQVELHPYFAREALIKFCKDNKIEIQAYSPLGSGKQITEDPVLKEIAKKYQKTPAQIAIKWAVQRGTCVLPKSVHSHRIDENFDVWDFELTEDDMKCIGNLDKNTSIVDIGKLWGWDVFA